LYRTNAQSSSFEQIFLQEGIPYKVFGAFKFFERKEVKDILAYIKYVINPQDSVSLKRILNVPERGIGKTTIEKISEYALSQSISFHETLQQLHTDVVKLTPKAKT
jgi:DNA helicase-2/ATP-dependent DNA helicase PcrA